MALRSKEFYIRGEGCIQSHLFERALSYHFSLRSLFEIAFVFCSLSKL